MNAARTSLRSRIEKSRRLRRRLLRVQSLEDRRLLASVTLQPIRDNSLFSENTNSAGADDGLFAGATNNANIRRALLDFDLTSAGIPADALITGVELATHVSVGSGNHAFSLHPILADWGEGTSVGAGSGGGRGGAATANDATWQHAFFSTTDWAAIGGDFDAVASATTQIQGAGNYSWSSQGLVDDVTSWLSDPASNHGWMIIGEESSVRSARRFDSREHAVEANRPALTITYEIPVQTTQSFQNAVATVEIVSGSSRETISLTGPVTIETTFAGADLGDAADVSPADGLDEVQTEVVGFNLMGESSSFGAVTFSLGATNPSLGSLVEQVDLTSGILDLDPFATGSADATVGLFFAFDGSNHASLPFRNDDPLLLTGSRDVFDFESGDELTSQNSVDLVGQAGASTGFTIESLSLRMIGSDFGDAPDARAGTRSGDYRTLASDDGASHVMSGPRLGNSVDAEFDGRPSVNADGDDQQGAVDDEDGISFLSTIPGIGGDTFLISGAAAGEAFVSVDLQNADALSNRLDAWIDWNRDGDWDDAGEQVLTDVDLGVADGTTVLSFLVPQAVGLNVSEGESYARFRLSTAGGLSPTGQALDGEVEDYRITLQRTPAEIIVNTIDDDGIDFEDADVTLREAIMQSNAFPDVQTIVFDSALTDAGPATIAINGTELVVTDSVVIQGPGANLLSIDGGGQSRILNINDGDDVNEISVSLSGIMLTGGNASDGNAGMISDADLGGAIVSAENLSIFSSVVSANTAEADAGGIQSSGSLWIEDSVVADNVSGRAGGGLRNLGPLTLLRSTVSGNRSAGRGGGIESLGDAELANSAIIENESQGEGGGWWNGGNSSIVNSTVSDNQADSVGGGIRNEANRLVVRQSTIVGNRSDSDGAGGDLGGGIATFDDNQTFTTLTGSIVAGNRAGAEGNDQDSDLFGGALQPGSTNNLIGDPNSAGGLIDDVDGNLVGSSGQTVFDLATIVDPLADNGGLTQTHALATGSPAIDAGDPAVDGSTLPFDQRGDLQPRVSGGRIDIGAFEQLGPNQPPSFTVSETVVVNEDDGQHIEVGFVTSFDPGFGESGTSSQTQALWNEGGGGMADPLSTNNQEPTDLGTLSLGSNTVLGYLDTAATTGNVDVFRFTIPVGFQWNGLFVDDYAYLDPPPAGERNAFLAINDADFFPFDTFELNINTNPDLDTSQFLGGAVFGLNDLPSEGGGDILPLVGRITGRGFTGPLGAGVYTVYIQQTGPANTYALDFQVTTITAQTAIGFTVSNVSDDSLFEEAPAIDSDGNLVFTAATDANGTATFDITVQDSGGTASGGSDQSSVVVGTITIDPVNDAPAFTATDPPTAIENSGFQSVPDFATFSPGPANEVGQAVESYLISNVGNPALFAEGPAIDQNGNLTYTLADNQFGMSTFEVAVRDDGGTANGGEDTSVVEVFTITVDESIDALDFGDAPAEYPVLLADDGARHVVGDLFLGPDVDAEPDGQAADVDEDIAGGGVFVLTAPVSSTTATTTATVTVQSSAMGRIDAWIDFNQDGDWDDLGEQILSDVDVESGDNALAYTVPVGATAGETQARFRLSTAGLLGPTGPAIDGEVEDRPITIASGALVPTVLLDVSQANGELSITIEAITLFSGNQTTFQAPASDVGSIDFKPPALLSTLDLVVGSGLMVPASDLVFRGFVDGSTLVLRGPGQVDLTNPATQDSDGQITLDLSHSDESTVTIDGPLVSKWSSDTQPMQLLTGPGDRVRFSDADRWRLADPILVGGEFRLIAQTISGDPAMIEMRAENPWHNLVRPSDVNNDGNVMPADALTIINQIRSGRFLSDDGQRELVDPLTLGQWPSLYLDQNGDGRATPIDALAVINQIRRSRNGPSGESLQEASAAGNFGQMSQLSPFDADRHRILFERLDVLDGIEMPSGLAIHDLDNISARSAEVVENEAARYQDGVNPSEASQQIDDLLFEDSFLESLRFTH